MIARMLYRLSASLPARLIQRTPGDPYLERYLVSARPGRYVYLHRFVAADMDEDLHDHPWLRAWSLVLCGGYEETRLDSIDARAFSGLRTSTRWRRAGHVARITDRCYHRIGRTLPETWTLFVHSEWTAHQWGFLEVEHPDEGELELLVRHNAYPHQSDPWNPWWQTAPMGRDLAREPLCL
jgi:hypothetical protein